MSSRSQSSEDSGSVGGIMYSTRAVGRPWWTASSKLKSEQPGAMLGAMPEAMPGASRDEDTIYVSKNIFYT